MSSSHTKISEFYSNEYGLFDIFGVELEYMIVDQKTLNVLPACDRLFKKMTGHIVSDIDRGPISLSNELVSHVVELKTSRPVQNIRGIHKAFHQNIVAINEALDSFGARLMPTGLHPWMDPFKETVIWPYEYHRIYDAYNKIFNCKGHGWSNVQSAHLNLPFKDDREFALLHAAIRMVLPLIPALAASTPFQDGKATGLADVRLHHYCHITKTIHSIAGDIIPEPIYSKVRYYDEILNRSYADIEPYDPEGILRDEFLNSRAAIARFDRGAIEIRLVDTAECPAMDEAVLMCLIEAVKYLTGLQQAGETAIKDYPTDKLRALLDAGIRDAGQAVLFDQTYLDIWDMGLTSGLAMTSFWEEFVSRKAPSLDADPCVQLLCREGPVASRIIRRTGQNPTQTALFEVYSELCDCLAENRNFIY